MVAALLYCLLCWKRRLGSIPRLILFAVDVRCSKPREQDLETPMRIGKQELHGTQQQCVTKHLFHICLLAKSN